MAPHIIYFDSASNAMSLIGIYKISYIEGIQEQQSYQWHDWWHANCFVLSYEVDYSRKLSNRLQNIFYHVKNNRWMHDLYHKINHKPCKKCQYTMYNAMHNAYIVEQ